MLIKVLELRPLKEFRLDLNFSDGTRGVADLTGLIGRGGTMIEPLADPHYFARVFIEAGAPTWPNGFDLAPWALHEELKQAGTLEPSGHVA